MVPVRDSRKSLPISQYPQHQIQTALEALADMLGRSAETHFVGILPTCPPLVIFCSRAKEVSAIPLSELGAHEIRLELERMRSEVAL